MTAMTGEEEGRDWLVRNQDSSSCHYPGSVVEVRGAERTSGERGERENRCADERDTREAQAKDELLLRCPGV